MISNKSKREIPLYIMLLPAVVFTLLFAYAPMFGLVIVFQDYYPAFGFLKSDWVGLENFKFLFGMPEVLRALKNTIVIASLKIVGGLVCPIFIAILLNEIKKNWYKRTLQTLVYFPHFISWIILGGIFMELLSLDGIVNQFLGLFGMTPTLFLGSNSTFQGVLVVTDIWKSFGWGTIVFLAAITSINPELYESAKIDGASRYRQIWNITLPGMASVIVLVATLSIGNILNAGFEQVLTLYSPSVYETGEIIDTLVYKVGLVEARYSLGAAVALYKSVVSLGLIGCSYTLAYKYAGYRIF